MKKIFAILVLAAFSTLTMVAEEPKKEEKKAEKKAKKPAKKAEEKKADEKK